ncbi:ras guanyl-releasing protein 3 isoform X2 [Exaiptasia diaphana]|nr:ras guanyl-releasing protein 3 isoform X2 [Exaiptasia diaphana]XP_020893117.1 ras guanyl-releasing protein 3 isoform X2 [Exaiptasia diaphana]
MSNVVDYIVEEDDSGRHIRAATLEKLVEFCVDEFDENGPIEEEPVLSKAVFIAHQWFVESDKLLEIFLNAYVKCKEIDASTAENSRRFSICQAVSYWMAHHQVDFRRNEQLIDIHRQLESIIDAEGDQSLKDIIDYANIGFHDIHQRAVSVNIYHGRSSFDRKVSLAFHDQSPLEIAEQLTYLDFKILRRIPFSEWKSYAVFSKLEQTPYLERYVSMLNGLSKWIQAMVLNHKTPEERAKCMEKFQKVAKHLKELQNFNGLLAVSGGLTNSVLSRLHLTREYISPDCKEYITLLAEFMSSESNYSTYRKRLSCCSGFFIPVLGIQLKDLIATNTALPDIVNGNLINVHKLVTLSGILSKFFLVQKLSPPVSPNVELLNMLRVSTQPRLSEDELYELSLAREPRNLQSVSSSSSLLDSVSKVNTPDVIEFGDWASGTFNAPDSRVLERHVTAMVEAVFRVYDTDKDGYISDNEFDSIATNFPFIDTFGVIDVNSDGVITKEEMKNYFLKVNSQNLSREFSHNFQETTYFSTTFCHHCGGVLRGIIKQGYRCKGCHVNCHKSCKKLIVTECRSKSPPLNVNKTDTLKKIRNRMKFVKSSTVESIKLQNGETVNVPADFYDRLLKAEESRDALLMENANLSSQLDDADKKITLLQDHLDLLRQHTVSFILEQMDALQLQKVTAV